MRWMITHHWTHCFTLERHCWTYAFTLERHHWIHNLTWDIKFRWRKFFLPTFHQVIINLWFHHQLLGFNCRRARSRYNPAPSPWTSPLSSDERNSRDFVISSNKTLFVAKYLARIQGFIRFHSFVFLSWTLITVYL